MDLGAELREETMKIGEITTTSDNILEMGIPTRQVM